MRENVNRMRIRISTEMNLNFGCLKFGEMVISVSCARNSLSATDIPPRDTR
jgi:hypothetical protein